MSTASFLHLRVARPVGDLARTTEMYVRGLGLSVMGSFEGQDGFDGVMLGNPGSSYHFEFTRGRVHPVEPATTPVNLVVLYIPVKAEWRAACARMLAAGFKRVVSYNSYREMHGCTFEDADGYRVVLEQAEWRNVGVA